uniref:Uncharacterized protein n=1 Tax=Arundo donax TaxID=35708 RepID=A0A0A8Y9A9_ARUDO
MLQLPHILDPAVATHYDVPFRGEYRSSHEKCRLHLSVFWPKQIRGLFFVAVLIIKLENPASKLHFNFSAMLLLSSLYITTVQ